MFWKKKEVPRTAKNFTERTDNRRDAHSVIKILNTFWDQAPEKTFDAMVQKEPLRAFSKSIDAIVKATPDWQQNRYIEVFLFHY